MRKNPRIFLTTLLTFTVIAIMRSCSGHHLNHESKVGEYIKENPIPKVTYEDFIKPIEENNEKTNGK